MQSGGSVRSQRVSSSSGHHDNRSSDRSADLEPFIQNQCSDAVHGMALQLDSQLQLLREPAMDLSGATLVEQALLLGECWSPMFCISLAVC